MMFDVSGGVSLHFDDGMLRVRIVCDRRFTGLCQFGFFRTGILLCIPSRTKRFDMTLWQNLNSPPLVLGTVEHARVGLAATTAPARY